MWINQKNRNNQNFKQKSNFFGNFRFLTGPSTKLWIKSFRKIVVILLITGWFFSGWPQIWQNPPLPPEIQVVRAAVQEYTSGSGNFTAQVTGNHTIILVGGGGQGGGGGGTTNSRGGGGGGGGANLQVIVSLTKDSQYAYAVGAGGTGGTKSTDGGNGGDTTFIVGGTTYTAGKGFGGGVGINGAAAGGAAGTATNGDTNRTGGTGGAGSASSGAGGGGSAAGTGAIGNNGQSAAEGSAGGAYVATYGGAGGIGATSASAAGSPGSSATDNYGGGGGGGTKNGAGGVGQVGYIIITWNAPPGSPSQDSPTDTQTGVSVTPTFQMTADDPDSDNIGYSITIYSDTCSTQIQYHDQASGEAGWGSNASCTNPPTNCYLDNSQGSFTLQSADALSNETTYYWKAAAKDPDGSGSWATSTTCYSFETESGLSLTFTVSTDNFPNLTPGNPVWATSTLVVNTNSGSGWNVAMYGNNKTLTNNALCLGACGDNMIPDPDPLYEWSVGSGVATTTGGTAATVSSGDDFLYFRVMSASGTESFLSTGWWGSDDTPFTNAKWAGIASTTNASRIGDSSVSSGGSNAVNTVLYYVDVPPSQAQGTYTGTITFTALPN